MVEKDSQSGFCSRARELFVEQQNAIYVRTDRMFASLMVVQWIAGIIIANVISPLTWAGSKSGVHIHLLAAIWLGGLITIVPVVMALTQPGKTQTRHIIAIGQTLYSALLIDLTGGRIESHFHIFGSLAFLAFYRDWQVLITASTVVALDHVLRGFYLPQSVYGVASVQPWRWVEHSFWVIFEDFFLIRSCQQGVTEMWSVAQRQATVEETRAGVERTVEARTCDLNALAARISGQYALASMLAKSQSLFHAAPEVLRILAEEVLVDVGAQFGALWLLDENETELSCTSTWCKDSNAAAASFAQTCRNMRFAVGSGLPGFVADQRRPATMQETIEHGTFFRREIAEKCGLTKGLGFPLRSETGTYAVIELLGDTSFEFEEMLPLLESLGRQIGEFCLRIKTEVDNHKLANVVQSAGNGIVCKYLDNRIVSWNKGAERIYGYTSDEMIKQSIELLYPEQTRAEILKLNARALEGEYIENFETIHAKKNGKLIDVSMTLSPIFDDQKRICGVSEITQDISERKAAEKRVNEFYSTVSHELRTPLTAIRGALGLVVGKVVDPTSEDAFELLETAQGSADRLIRLINDILDLRKLEAGKLELHIRSVPVSDLLESCINEIRPMASEHSVELRTEAAFDNTLMVDWDRILQVLTNLVSNAVKFSPPGSTVVVSAEQIKRTRIRFSVTDSGKGIPADQMHKLFGRFQQLDSSDTRSQNGTGLGLAISKAIVEEHGGDIGVSSTFGSGATFWFELESAASEETVHEILPFALDVMQKPADGILVVEDDEQLASVIETLLKTEGWEVLRARTIGEAQKCVSEMTPKAVILDLGLPDGDGMSLLEELRAKAETRSIPVIVTTGKKRDQDTFDSPTIVDWLTKPFDLRHLVTAIKRALHPPAQKRVLIVDDDQGVRKILKTHLHAMDVECIEASNGVECLSIMRFGAPDLMILDLKMPGKTGFEVIESLGESLDKAVPLIIYSGVDLSLEERARLTDSVRTYVAKWSLSPQEFALLVKDMLDNLQSQSGTAETPERPAGEIESTAGAAG